jgi:hypothetical protein
MFCVYWLGELVAQHKKFNDNAMVDALKFTEDLRKKQASGESVSFVTLVSENPNSVGRPGAADVDADYNWKKRR